MNGFNMKGEDLYLSGGSKETMKIVKQKEILTHHAVSGLGICMSVFPERM